MENEVVQPGNSGGVSLSRLQNLLTSPLFKWAFVLSCTAMSSAFGQPNFISALETLAAFAIIFYLTFYQQLLEKIFIPFNRPALYAAIFCTPVALGFWSNTKKLVEKIPAVAKVFDSLGIPTNYHGIVSDIAAYLVFWMTALCLIAFLYSFFARLVPFIVEIAKESDAAERWFFTAAFLTAAVAVPLIYNQTNAFYAPVWEGKTCRWEVVYTFDSNMFMTTYYLFPYILHRCLSYLFFLPFYITAFLLGKVFFFLPNSFPVFLNLVQIPLLLSVPVLLSRLLNLKTRDKNFFLPLFSLTYSALLGSLTFDGYIFCTFWLTVFLYIALNKKKDDWNCSFAYTAAAGSLLTSGILLPLTANWSALKNGIIGSIRSLFVFFTFAIMFGGILPHLRNILYYRAFTGVTIPFQEKVLQFINFIASCFMKPETMIDKPLLMTVNWMDYQLVPVTSVNLLGVTLLAVAILGFALNWKDSFARICGFWILFSFFVLCLVGWGTAENGLILYSLYFGWAYFCLVFLAIEKSLQKLLAVKYGVYTAAMITLAAINLPGIWDLIQFGIKYYPVK